MGIAATTADTPDCPLRAHSCAATYLPRATARFTRPHGVAGIGSANRGVHQLDGVKNRPVVPDTPRRGRDLQRAARIGGRNHIRRRGGQVAHFPLAEVRGRPRRDQVVDAGAAAADFGFGRRHQLDARNRLQQRARLGAHALAVREVTGVVVDDAGRDRAGAARAGGPSSASTCDTSRTLAARARARPAHAGSCSNSSPYSFIAEPQPAAFTAMQSTSSRSNTSMLWRASCAGLLDVPGVQRQRAAAALGLGRLHPAPFRGQHAHGGLVHVRERQALHAAGEQRHPAALGARRPASPAPRAGACPPSVTGGASSTIATSRRHRPFRVPVGQPSRQAAGQPAGDAPAAPAPSACARDTAPAPSAARGRRRRRPAAGSAARCARGCAR